MYDFYTTCKDQKASGFMMFSGGVEAEHCLKMGRCMTSAIGQDLQLRTFQPRRQLGYYIL